MALNLFEDSMEDTMDKKIIFPKFVSEGIPSF